MRVLVHDVDIWILVKEHGVDYDAVIKLKFFYSNGKLQKSWAYSIVPDTAWCSIESFTYFVSSSCPMLPRLLFLATISLL